MRPIRELWKPLDTFAHVLAASIAWTLGGLLDALLAFAILAAIVAIVFHFAT